MIKRYIENELKLWFDNYKKPLLVDGARQVGKTTTIKNFLQQRTKKYIFIDLHADHDNELIKLVKQHNIHHLVDYLQEKYAIKKEQMVIFFDEIQECKEIVPLLKYFNEQYNMIKVVASGSLFSLEFSEHKTFFPVGKIKIISMYPMTFYEFIDSYNKTNLLNNALKSVLSNKAINDNIHQELLNLFHDYLFIGGMPEVVNYYIEANNTKNYDENIVNEIKQNLSDTYFRDISSHFDKSDMKSKVLAILDSLHIQLNNNNKRFMLSMVKEMSKSSKPRMSRYKNTIDKLIISNIVNKLDAVYDIYHPLSNYVDNGFKLFYNDISFYTIKYNDIKPSNMTSTNKTWNAIKGGLIENYVNNELCFYLTNRKFYFYKNKNGTREMDFIFEIDNLFYLIEAKSNFGGSVKSLSTFYHDRDKLLIKSGLNNYYKNEFYINIPIYLIGLYINEILNKNKEKF